VTDVLEQPGRPAPRRGHRRRKRRLVPRLIAVAFVLALLAVLVWLGSAAYDAVSSRFESAPDYTGTGTGEVVVQIEPGDTGGDIAATLVEEGVVKSAAAFNEAALAEPRSSTLQPGFYTLRERMSAAAALEMLLDPASRVVGRVTVPEGRTVQQTLEILAESTEIPLADYQAAIADAPALGLPAYADGNPEGFLFPATYDVEPGATARDVLSQMFARFQQAAETVGLKEGAAALGRSPYDVVIVASLIEREVRYDDEYPKVARVVYNRLDKGIPLGIDAAILYGVGKTGGGELTASDLAKDTPYENRRQTGLPPTPIASPGEATLEAALNPAEGDILYYVLATADGRTFFTNDYDEFLAQRDKSRREGIF
jgi:UPF0755 protein